MINIQLSGIQSWVQPEAVFESALNMNQQLHDGSGAGNDFLGWVQLPNQAIKQVDHIARVCLEFGQELDCIVVIGIGGSYLGTKSVLTALRKPFDLKSNQPEMIFAGHHLDQAYHTQLLSYLKHKNWGMVVISKSGTTTEPAVAFRFLRQHLVNQFGQAESKKRILAVTDEAKGALRSLADAEGYTSFVIPDDVGGRYSVLTPVGLVPIALAGIDIVAMVNGAINLMETTLPGKNIQSNLPAQYAAARFSLYQTGKSIEILSNFNPALHDVAEWWKQLYGESEGKENKGIFPASVDLTTDLHSMGQYIQEGERTIFETALLIQAAEGNLTLPEMEEDADQLNYLAGKSMSYINEQAAEGTLLAHQDGDVPVIRLELDKLDAYRIGQLFYFFEKACGISGYLLGVNPFDQPGVEAYKKNMFALLGKPGFETQTQAIRKRLQ